MSFAVLSPAFRGLQFPFRDMIVLTVDRNSFTGNNGRPSYKRTEQCITRRIEEYMLFERLCSGMNPTNPDPGAEAKVQSVC